MWKEFDSLLFKTKSDKHYIMYYFNLVNNNWYIFMKIAEFVASVCLIENIVKL